jgi:hypothetical protein
MRQHLYVTLLAAVMAALVATNARAQTQDIVRDRITLRGTVEAVDHTARVVRIRGDRGNVVTLDVPASVTRLNEVRVGDVVTASYYDVVNIRPKPANEPAVDTVADPTTTRSPGTLPGATVAAQRVATVTINAWDAATNTVTFTGPRGQSYTRRLAASLDPALKQRLQVGDRADITWTEAVTLSVERGRAAQQPAPEEDAFRHRFTISALWGPDNQVSGKMITEGSGTLQGVPIDLDETSYDDVYGRMGLFKVGVGYRTSPRSEVVVNFAISRSSSEPVTVGTVGAASAPVVASFDDYNYWGLEAGQRFYFARVRFTPFLGYIVGINRFDAINADFAAPAAGFQAPIVVNDGQFFDSAWAFSFGPTGGVLIGLGPIEVMGEVALRYMGGLSDVDPLSEAGLRDINSESSRWSFPIMIGARIRF